MGLCYSRFIYKDDPHITTSNAVQTLYVAKKYLVPGLARKCSEFLEKSIHQDNVCILLDQGLAVDERALVDQCLNNIMSRTKPVLKSSHWLKLSKQGLAAVLDCPNLSVEEVTVFNACLKWASAQCEKSNAAPIPANQRAQLGDLLFKINVTNMSLGEFSEHVVPSGLLKDSEELVVFKKLTNPSLLVETPFATGRQNCLFLLRPYHILDMASQGECNFDSVSFTYTLTVYNPLCLSELHLYDLLGPHVINVTIKSKSSADVPALGYSVRDLKHRRQYEEKHHRTFVYSLGRPEPLNLSQSTYELTLTLLGEFDTDLFDPLQFGDVNLSVTRQEREAPLFALGYKVEDPDGKNPRPAVGKLSRDTLLALPPRPPKPTK